MKKEKIAAFAVVLLALGLISLTGCVFERSNNGQQSGQSGAETGKWQGGTESKSPDSEEAIQKASSLDWQKYELGDYSFYYPAGWTVEISKKSNDDDADFYIAVKSTDKAVVLGGAASDDYYVEKDGKNVVNADKYAESFVLITVDVYQNFSGMDWQAIADKIYPNVVEKFALYSVSGRTDIEVVKIEKAKGILGGAPRLFVRTKKAVYDVSLQYKNWEAKDAEAVLNKFFVQFPF